MCWDRKIHWEETWFVKLRLNPLKNENGVGAVNLSNMKSGSLFCQGRASSCEELAAESVFSLMSCWTALLPVFLLLYFPYLASDCMALLLRKGPGKMSHSQRAPVCQPQFVSPGSAELGLQGSVLIPLWCSHQGLEPLAVSCMNSPSIFCPFLFYSIYHSLLFVQVTV